MEDASEIYASKRKVEAKSWGQKLIYFQFETPNKQMMVFFRTRMGKILILQKLP